MRSQVDVYDVETNSWEAGKLEKLWRPLLFYRIIFEIFISHNLKVGKCNRDHFGEHLLSLMAKHLLWSEVGAQDSTMTRYSCMTPQVDAGLNFHPGLVWPDPRL